MKLQSCPSIRTFTQARKAPGARPSPQLAPARRAGDRRRPPRRHLSSAARSSGSGRLLRPALYSAYPSLLCSESYQFYLQFIPSLLFCEEAQLEHAQRSTPVPMCCLAWRSPPRPPSPHAPSTTPPRSSRRRPPSAHALRCRRRQQLAAAGSPISARGRGSEQWSAAVEQGSEQHRANGGASGGA